MSETQIKNYKTSEERRTYQKNYYKSRMEKQKQLESQIKLSGGDILSQSMDETIDSDDDYKITPIEHKKQFEHIIRVENSIPKTKNEIKTSKPQIEIKPQINKEQIVNFKLKKAINWISQNVQKDGELYLEEMADQLGYNIETIHGLHEVLKVAETYFDRIW